MLFMVPFLFRRESPWKIDGKSMIPSKLKLLEDELTNLEKVGKGELSKVPSLMRKQAKRYQGLAGKIDDLCRRMVILTPLQRQLFFTKLILLQLIELGQYKPCLVFVSALMLFRLLDLAVIYET